MDFLLINIDYNHLKCVTIWGGNPVCTQENEHLLSNRVCWIFDSSFDPHDSCKVILI